MAKTNGMDLASIGEVKETAQVTLFHPATGEPLLDGDGNEMWVEVYGQDSAHYKAVDRTIQNRNIQRMQSTRGGGRSMTAEGIEAQNLERLTKCLAAWHIVVGGSVPECDEKSAREVFQNYPWVREQVEDAVHNRKHFLTGSSGS